MIEIANEPEIMSPKRNRCDERPENVGSACDNDEDKPVASDIDMGTVSSQKNSRLSKIVEKGKYPVNSNLRI